MRDFLSEFMRGSDAACTVIVMDEGYMEQPRRYHLRPFRLLVLATSTLLGVALLTIAVLAFTPLRRAIPGYGTVQVERSARQNARRTAALEDSLRRQSRYLHHLQSLMTGPVDSSFVAGAQAARDAEAPPTLTGERAAVAASPSTSAGEATAPRSPFVPARLPENAPVLGNTVRAANLDQLQFPVFPPAEGFVTRGFEAQTGHYAVDIAAEAGTPVRSIGDGYIVMSDRTQQGGQAVAVQHAGGYLSLYKHNRRLLKRVGERVEAREVIAESGNSGEITSGPHLHVELWHDGLAQDPAAYFIGS
jgi:murein DD-endopeptidase MepM/ murein hydrolase activator NlpD